MEETANVSFSDTTITCQFLTHDLWLELLYGIIPIIYLTNVLQCIIFMFWIYKYKRKRLSHECRPDKREREGGRERSISDGWTIHVREGGNKQLSLSVRFIKKHTHMYKVMKYTMQWLSLVVSWWPHRQQNIIVGREVSVLFDSMPIIMRPTVILCIKSVWSLYETSCPTLCN